MSSENVAGVRRFVDAFNRLDLDSVLGDIHPEAELHEWPEAPGARSYQGAIRSFNVYTFRDGKVTGIRLFLDREPALEAAGLTPHNQKEKR